MCVCGRAHVCVSVCVCVHVQSSNLTPCHVKVLKNLSTSLAAAG